MGSGTSTRAVPPFRAFDLLATPNQALVLLENADHRIGVASICGAREEFRRHVDFDTVYLQFAGRTQLETEFGEVEMKPGDLIHIPGRHRAPRHRQRRQPDLVRPCRRSLHSISWPTRTRSAIPSSR